MNRFLIYFVLEVLVIGSVILIFRIVEDRQLAASIAGVLFIFVPLLILFKEVLKHRSRNWLFLSGHVQFLILFAIPIMSLRLFYWGQPFSDLSLGLIRGEQLHQWANFSYFFMMFTTLNARRSYSRLNQKK